MVLRAKILKVRPTHAEKECLRGYLKTLLRDMFDTRGPGRNMEPSLTNCQ